MGTTTLCLQLVKFLKAFGYSACYFDWSSQGHVFAIAAAAGERTEKNYEHYTYDGIEMYGPREPKDKAATMKKLTDPKSSTHDYIICDFGCAQSSSFCQNEYFNSVAQIMTVGSAPQELFIARSFLQSNCPYINSIFAFYLTPHNIEEWVLGQMADKSSQTFFIPNRMYDPLGDYPELYKGTGFFAKLMGYIEHKIENPNSVQESAPKDISEYRKQTIRIVGKDEDQ